MADRKQFFGEIKADPDLLEALEASRQVSVTEEELREQSEGLLKGQLTDKCPPPRKCRRSTVL